MKVDLLNEYAEVTLKDGTVVKIDHGDLWVLEVFPLWYNTKGYISCVRNIPNEYGHLSQRVYLHRLILKSHPKWQIDHANRDKADNRRSNLRMATSVQNSANTSRKRRPKSGFRGVIEEKRMLKKPFCAYIGGTAGGRRNIGRFETAEEAARAYDKEAKARYGDFAVINFPD